MWTLKISNQIKIKGDPWKKSATRFMWTLKISVMCMIKGDPWKKKCNKMFVDIKDTSNLHD